MHFLTGQIKMKNKIIFITTKSLNDFILFAVQNGLAYTVDEIGPSVFHVYVTGY